MEKNVKGALILKAEGLFKIGDFNKSIKVYDEAQASPNQNILSLLEKDISKINTNSSLYGKNIIEEFFLLEKKYSTDFPSLGKLTQHYLDSSMIDDFERMIVHFSDEKISAIINTAAVNLVLNNDKEKAESLIKLTSDPSKSYYEVVDKTYDNIFVINEIKLDFIKKARNGFLFSKYIDWLWEQKTINSYDFLNYSYEALFEIDQENIKFNDDKDKLIKLATVFIKRNTDFSIAETFVKKFLGYIGYFETENYPDSVLEKYPKDVLLALANNIINDKNNDILAKYEKALKYLIYGKFREKIIEIGKHLLLIKDADDNDKPGFEELVDKYYLTAATMDDTVVETVNV